MKGIARAYGYSPLVALFLEHFEAPDMTSVENRRKRFVANRSRRGFYRVVRTNRREVWSGTREERPGCEGDVQRGKSGQG